MNIFIVEEMYRTEEIRLKDDKDLSLTEPINSCLQMTKADRSKATKFFCTGNLSFPIWLEEKECSKCSDICVLVSEASSRKEELFRQ